MAKSLKVRISQSNVRDLVELLHIHPVLPVWRPHLLLPSIMNKKLDFAPAKHKFMAKLYGGLKLSCLE